MFWKKPAKPAEPAEVQRDDAASPEPDLPPLDLAPLPDEEASPKPAAPKAPAPDMAEDDLGPLELGPLADDGKTASAPLGRRLLIDLNAAEAEQPAPRADAPRGDAPRGDAPAERPARNDAYEDTPIVPLSMDAVSTGEQEDDAPIPLADEEPPEPPSAGKTPG